MKRPFFGIAAALSLTLGASVVHADASSDAAHEALKIMTDYVSGLDAISFDLSVDMEAVTTAGIKLQFSASGKMILDRPDRFRVVRTGGHSDIELISDGDTLTLSGRKLNVYAQKDAPESLDAFVNSAREHGIEMPGADLIISNSHAELSGPVTTAMYLGAGIVDGTECEHLAFRTSEVDWQIWIATGKKPFPCKYVVTSKWVAGGPQYQLRISNWNDSPNIAADTFQFQPSGDAKKIDLSEIKQTDILLPETLQGAKK